MSLPVDIDEGRRLASELTVIHESLHRIGLHKTAHALWEALNEIGYELAVHIEDQQRNE